METATRPVRCLVTKKGQSVDTHLTDQEALALCDQLPADSFGAELAMKFRTRGLSYDQTAWLHILALKVLKNLASYP